MSIILAAGLVVISVPLLAIALIVGAMTIVGVFAGLLSAIIPGEKTIGEVVEVGAKRAGRSTPPRVAYYTPTGRFEISASSHRLRLGDQVPVRYRPGKPSRAGTGSQAQLWRTLIMTIPAVAVIAALSAGMLVSAVWRFTGSHGDLQIPLGCGSVVLVVSLIFGALAVNHGGAWLRWRRMVHTEGKILEFKAPPKGQDRPGRIRISFQAAEGEKEFWATGGTVHGDVGDTVTVHYNPAKPERSATVHEFETVRAYAICFTVLALIMGGLGGFMLSLL